MTRSIERWRARLGLFGWRVRFSPEEPRNASDNAAVTWSHDYGSATVRLREGWELWDDRRLEETVCHELLHLVFRELDFVVREVLEVDAQLSRVWEHALEGAVDQLARQFVALAPSAA